MDQSRYLRSLAKADGAPGLSGVVRSDQTQSSVDRVAKRDSTLSSRPKVHGVEEDSFSIVKVNLKFANMTILAIAKCASMYPTSFHE